MVKKCPIALKAELWKSFEPVIYTRFLLGYIFCLAYMFLIMFFLFNFGNMVSWETNLQLIINVTGAYLWNTFIAEFITTFFLSILELLRRISTGDTKKFFTNVLILRMIAKEMKNMG